MMTKPISFSVVIPLYNKQKSIQETLTAALNQTHKDVEIIVVDDGSTDKGVSMVQSFTDPRIRLFRQSNAGVSAARNKGIKEARHRFIAFLDADDLWEAEYLTEMAALIRDHPGAGMYGCAFDKVDNTQVYTQNFHLPAGFRGYVEPYFEQARKNVLFWTSAVVIDKALIEPVGLFDERINILGEDLDMWFRVAVHCRVVFLNKVLAHYNIGAENRGMQMHCPFNRSILYYASQYDHMGAGNKAFHRYINLFRLQKIPDVFLRYGLDKDAIQSYLKTIHLPGQKLKHQAFLHLPYFWQKLIIRVLFGHDYQ